MYFASSCNTDNDVPAKYLLCRLDMFGIQRIGERYNDCASTRAHRDQFIGPKEFGFLPKLQIDTGGFRIEALDRQLHREHVDQMRCRKKVGAHQDGTERIVGPLSMYGKSQLQIGFPDITEFHKKRPQ